ncbi:alpha/beta fold hydrolase [Stigmatella aurantiaca]|nr:alpha/beta hydrolase [Stigmatella aurantiaca]
MIFIHGWPELSSMWWHQLECFSALGFRCVAPDMRGYGGSSQPSSLGDFALEHIVEDMLELLGGLGAERALWIGHDWGAPVVWSLASHHAGKCIGAVNLCVPYLANGFAPPNLVPLVNRTLYPEAQYPAGQWDYMLFYEKDFEAVRAVFEANVPALFKALIRRGSAEAVRKPSRTATVSRDGGWFGGASQAPVLPRDEAVLSQEALDRYVEAFETNGFFGPNAWYMNHRQNMAYAAKAPGEGKLRLPVLFLHAAYDAVCETMDSRLAEPMRRDCLDLTEAVLETGHWMVQEQPERVNAAIARWLAARVPEFWPFQEYRKPEV